MFHSAIRWGVAAVAAVALNATGAGIALGEEIPQPGATDDSLNKINNDVNNLANQLCLTDSNYGNAGPMQDCKPQKPHK